MTDNLTLKDCFLYSKATIISDPTTNTFSNVKNLIEYAHESMLTIQQLLDFNNCKLILRDISQLKDEEKLYIYNTFCNNYEEDKALLKDTFYNFMEILAYCGTENAVDLADYLREKNIMIEKENWFASGKAVKE